MKSNLTSAVFFMASMIVFGGAGCGKSSPTDTISDLGLADTAADTIVKDTVPDIVEDVRDAVADAHVDDSSIETSRADTAENPGDIFSDASDTADVIDDVPTPDMMEGICGSLIPDLEHVEGQPCVTEGASYCVDEGEYPKLLTRWKNDWYCMKPNYLECRQFSDQGLQWTLVNCDEFLRLNAGECKTALPAARCVQGGAHAACCPILAMTHAAAYGHFCEPSDAGTTDCIARDGLDNDRTVTCNYLAQASVTYPEELADQAPATDECDFLFAECTYWYVSDSCKSPGDCNHETACERGWDDFGEPYKLCPGQCIYDTVLGVKRCAETCQDLDDFFVE